MLTHGRPRAAAGPPHPPNWRLSTLPICPIPARSPLHHYPRPTPNPPLPLEFFRTTLSFHQHRLLVNMSDNVVHLDIPTKIDLPPEKVLENALSKIGDGVVVLGYNTEGDYYFSSSISDATEVLWLIEKLKQQLLEI